MSDEKRPHGPPSEPNDAPARKEAEPDFFKSGEHDGWGPIKRRRAKTSPSSPPSGGEEP